MSSFKMYTDTYGREIAKTYRVIHDPFFEQRLKLFDPNLRLMFDQLSKRWVILEKAYDGSGWNCILKAEYPDGKEKPLGEWVFNTLWVYRKQWEEKARRGADSWLDDIISKSNDYKTQQEKKLSEDNQDLIKDNITQWRKASKEIQNLPTSDAKAGYRKV